jgi:hypothetical protein
VRDLTDIRSGNLYEGKVILDKTNGHAVYGCAYCCGYSGVNFYLFAACGTGVGSNFQQATATLACTGGKVDITDQFDTWWTGSSSIAPANMNQIHGVAAGTTNHYASAQLILGRTKLYGTDCPVHTVTSQAPTNVCASPTTETTAVAGTAQGFPLVTQFNQTLSDITNESFDGREVAEQGGPGSNTCFWAFNTIGEEQIQR